MFLHRMLAFLNDYATGESWLIAAVALTSCTSIVTVSK